MAREGWRRRSSSPPARPRIWGADSWSGTALPGPPAPHKARPHSLLPPPGRRALTGSVLDLVRVQPHAVPGVEQLQHRPAGDGVRRGLPAQQRREQHEREQEREADAPHRSSAPALYLPRGPPLPQPATWPITRCQHRGWPIPAHFGAEVVSALGCLRTRGRSSLARR